MANIARMLSCPKCQSKLEEHRMKMTFSEIQGWKCTICDSFYSTKQLLKSLMTA